MSRVIIKIRVCATYIALVNQLIDNIHHTFSVSALILLVYMKSYTNLNRILTDYINQHISFLLWVFNVIFSQDLKLFE